MFDKFYHKDYESYKWTMPTSRFWGYWEFIIRQNENSNKSPEDIKRDKLEEIDWADEVKKLKRKKLHGNN